MSRASREKGARLEREFARLVGGRRVPLSGAAGDVTEDVVVPVRDGEWLAQVKGRRDGFRSLYRSLERADLLALRADRRGWLVVLPLERFLELRDGA